MQAVHTDCTGTLLLLAIPLHSIYSSQRWCHPHPASQLDRFLLSSTSSLSSPLAIVFERVGGAADGKLSRLGFETKCCGGFHQPVGLFFGSQNGHRDTTQENRIHMKELQNAQHHNHIYNNTFMHVHN